MNNKIFLLLIIFVAMMFVPTAKANAIHTYIGVQVTSATTTNTVSGGHPDANWCLPGGGPGTGYPVGTQITILSSGTNCDANSTGSGTTGTCVTPSAVAGSGPANPSTAGSTVPTCAGGTIWSSLVDISTQTKYVIKISTPNYCPGIYFTDYYYANTCMVTSHENEGCASVCDDYGLTSSPSSTTCYNSSFSDCTYISELKGSPCASCTSIPYNNGLAFNYYDNNGNCWYTTGGYGNAPNCSALGTNTTRACICNYNTAGNSFYFPFTTPSSF